MLTSSRALASRLRSGASSSPKVLYVELGFLLRERPRIQCQLQRRRDVSALHGMRPAVTGLDGEQERPARARPLTPLPSRTRSAWRSGAVARGTRVRWKREPTDTGGSHQATLVSRRSARRPRSRRPARRLPYSGSAFSFCAGHTRRRDRLRTRHRLHSDSRCRCPGDPRRPGAWR